jgi:serine/threonine-protein kinase
MLPRGRRLPINVSTAIAYHLCQVLGYAHTLTDAHGKRRPVIHGDVSPSNIMVRRDGGVTLIDFGVARVGSSLRGAHKNLVFGKCSYLAPEMLVGASDQRADVFSTGVVLYEMLTGSRLFVGRNDQDTLDQVLTARVRFPSVVSSAVTPQLDALVMRALDRDPDGRFHSAAEMAQALERLQGSGAMCSREQLAAFVRAFLDLPHMGAEDPVTAPIAPAVAESCRQDAVAAVIDAAHQRLDEQDEPHPDTATVVHRPPQPLRERPSAIPRHLCAAAALIITMLFPFTGDRLGFHSSDLSAATEPQEPYGLLPFERGSVYHAPHATPRGALKHRFNRLRSRR